MQRLVVLAFLLLILAWPARLVRADAGGWAIADGWYFPAHGGYTVRDVGGEAFWTAFRALGGTTSLGYPMSRRFTWGGQRVQVFERGVLARDPATATVVPLALLDALSTHGYDATLAVQFGIPSPVPAREAQVGPAIAWPEACLPCRRSVRLPSGASLPRSAFVAERLAWLASVPELARFYDATPWAPAVLGLPTALPHRSGDAVLVRFQRGVVRVGPPRDGAATARTVELLDVGVLARGLGFFGAGEQWTPEVVGRSQPAPAVLNRPVAPAPASVPVRGPITRGNPANGTVALTFDLGLTTSGALPTVLETLGRAGVRATFFITGAWAEAQPDMLRWIVAAGHELANHSHSHPDLTKISAAQAAWEIEHTEEVALRLAGRTTKPYFRPPFGAYNPSVLALVERLGFRLVMWTVDSADWRPEATAATIAERAGRRTAAGDIVVMHGYVAKTAAALPAILEALTARGLRPGTLSDALRTR